MDGQKTFFIDHQKVENQKAKKQDAERLSTEKQWTNKQKEEQRQPGRRFDSFVRSHRVLLFGTLLAAPAVWATPQEFPDQQVREIGTGAAAEGIYIVTANTENSLDGCGSRFFLEAGHPLLDQNLALALSALYAHNRVHIQVDGCKGAGAMRLKSIRAVR